MGGSVVKKKVKPEVGLRCLEVKVRWWLLWFSAVITKIAFTMENKRLSAKEQNRKVIKCTIGRPDQKYVFSKKIKYRSVRRLRACSITRRNWLSFTTLKLPLRDNWTQISLVVLIAREKSLQKLSFDTSDLVLFYPCRSAPWSGASSLSLSLQGLGQVYYWPPAWFCLILVP